MTEEIQKDLAKIIGLYTSDPVAARQLQGLNVFSLPEDSTAMFQGLLEKLEQRERVQSAGSA